MEEEDSLSCIEPPPDEKNSMNSTLRLAPFSLNSTLNLAETSGVGNASATAARIQMIKATDHKLMTDIPQSNVRVLDHVRLLQFQKMKEKPWQSREDKINHMVKTNRTALENLEQRCNDLPAEIEETMSLEGDRMPNTRPPLVAYDMQEPFHLDAPLQLDSKMFPKLDFTHNQQGLEKLIDKGSKSARSYNPAPRTPPAITVTEELER